MNLTENDVEKAIADLYARSQRPKLRTSSAYLYQRLQKSGVRVTKQEITDTLRRLHEKGVGILHPGGFYRQKFDFKENPRSLFGGNGRSEKVVEDKIEPSFSINLSLPVTNQVELKRTISMLMNLLSD